MENTKPKPIEKPVDTQQEVVLNLPDINKNLMLTTFTGVESYNSNYSEVLNEYRNNPSDQNFQNLLHDLLDAFPAIINVQIRDLFTPKGKSEGRFRLRQLGEVYSTLTQLLSSVVFANLWDLAIDETHSLKITAKQRKFIQQHIHSYSRQESSNDHFQLLSTICTIFKENDVPFYMPELLDLNAQLGSATKVYQAYQFFETDFFPRLKKNEISNEEVQTLCQTTEEQLGILLHASAFLANYEIIRVKDVTVEYPSRHGKPNFIHEKASINGREYPAIDQAPIAYTHTFNDHSIFLSRNAEADGLSLNLSPFIIDQNAFKGKRNFLPKIYFFSGIDQEKQIYFRHVDTHSLDFVLTNDIKTTPHSYLKQVRDSIQSFCEDIGI